MKIQNMFVDDINRAINGVVMVGQDDLLEQELKEYVVTKELEKHFRELFHNYGISINGNTSKVGVWISGFFGSGKSHFLKILSHLLANDTVNGIPTLDRFREKFEDPTLMAEAERCCSIPTESILFNIDVEGPVNKDDTAVLRTFAKVFYRHCGYYGDDLKIVKLEREIEKRGKKQQFLETFEQINGLPWIDQRDAFGLLEDDVVDTLQQVLGMSETAARNWFNGEETNELSIESLAKDIKEYVESKGRNFHLLFMVDEIGQYIGNNRSMLLNLQSLTEEIGNACHGQAWVMVTSQEAVESVVDVFGQEFSKILGRFDTRLHMTSSSVDEVIKRRLLKKKEEAKALLAMEFDQEQASLKNLFAFSRSVEDVKRLYKGRIDFAETFPFVPYQFIILQKSLTEIGKHGYAGKHMSKGERSMIECFQSSARAIQFEDETALAPFWRFYDDLAKGLDTSVVSVVERCQKAANDHMYLEELDVRVLKLLYLIRYIDDFPANLDNIAVLMTDNIHVDPTVLKQSLDASLRRLEHENYVARSGDTYSFLTDEEQDIAKEIKATTVDTAKIIQSIGRIIYEDIYPTKKYKIGRYDFGFDKYIDMSLYGLGGSSLKLRLLTNIGDYHDADVYRLINDSTVNREAYLKLSEEVSYYEELEFAEKIDVYAKKKAGMSMTETGRSILRRYQEDARKLKTKARDNLEKAILNGTIVICGDKYEIPAGSAKDKIDAILEKLAGYIYNKLYQINVFADSDADILAILRDKVSAKGFTGTGTNNEDAVHEIDQWLTVQEKKYVHSTMFDVQKRYGDAPYGWREIDIAACIARLIASQRLDVIYGGATVARDSVDLPKFLRQKSYTDKVTLRLHHSVDREVLLKSRTFLTEYFNMMDIPQDEEGIINFVLDNFQMEQTIYQDLLTQEYAYYDYPGKQAILDVKKGISDLLSRKNDNSVLLDYMLKNRDELLDQKEDASDVLSFFKSQRPTYDKARELVKKINKESEYFNSDEECQTNLRKINEILSMPRPYHRIPELPNYVMQLNEAYNSRLQDRIISMNKSIEEYLAKIHNEAGDGSPAVMKIVKEADDYYSGKKQSVNLATTLTEVDAAGTVMRNQRDGYIKRIQKQIEIEEEEKRKKREEEGKPVIKIETVYVNKDRLCPDTTLKTVSDVNAYVEDIRRDLLSQLGDNKQLRIH